MRSHSYSALAKTFLTNCESVLQLYLNKSDMFMTSVTLDDGLGGPETVYWDTEPIPGQNRGQWCPNDPTSNPYIQVYLTFVVFTMFKYNK